MAVVVSVATYLAVNYFTDQPITLGGTLKTAGFAILSSAATYGIGSACSSLIGNFLIRAAVQAVAHGVVQGTFSAIQGQNFWNGFAAGALSSIAASAWSGGDSFRHFSSTGVNSPTFHYAGIAGSFGDSVTGMVAFSAVMGGVGAELSGGNFWMGASSGLMVGWLNHAYHNDNGYDKNGNKVDDRGGDVTDYLYDDNGSIIGSTSVAFGERAPVWESADTMRSYGFKRISGTINEDNTIFNFYAGAKILGLGLSYAGKAIMNPTTGNFVLKNAKFLNKGNWWRLGEGTGKGAGHIRLSIGAHEKYINEVPKLLRPLNRLLRTMGNKGHFDFGGNWTW